MVNQPPLSEEKITKIVKAVYASKQLPFPTTSDEVIMTLVQQFLDMRKWVNNANFPLLCYACKEPLSFIAFSYKGQNFLFFHCWRCHSSPDFEKNQPHVSFGEFKKTLDELIKERQSKSGLFG